MDLTRLYNLTTSELREEAERLGVSDTYAMSRGQLIHAIRDQVGAPQPEGFFGKVLGFAKWALQTTAPAPRADEAAPRRGTAPGSVPVPVAAPGAASTSRSAPAVQAPGSDSGSVAAPDRGSASGSTAAPGPASEPAAMSAGGTLSQGESGDATASETSRTWGSSTPPAGVFSSSSGSFEEPFPTRTMARILADQGHFKRSLAIYAKLLRDDPGNLDLSAEADEVRSRSRRAQAH